jgi:glycosyltransferase involved in cell wall biosynthesis
VDSVLNQTYRNVEIIVVDDGSIDNTQAVLRKYGNLIRWRCQRNAGPSKARNTGVKDAKGDYVAFLDSDDAWAPEKLERQIRLLLQCGDDVSCCLCNTQFTGQKNPEKTAFEVAKIFPVHNDTVWTNPSEVLITRFVLFNQAVVVRKDIFTVHGGFDESLRLMEDYDLSLRLSMTGPWALIQEPLVYWYPEPLTSLSIGAERAKAEKAAYEILKNFVRDADLDSSLSALARRRLLALHRLLLISKGCDSAITKFQKLRFFVESTFSIFERAYGRLQPLPKAVTILPPVKSLTSSFLPT